MAFKGHDAEKNGIFAGLLATKAFATREASLSEPFDGARERVADGAGTDIGGIGI